MSRPAARLAVSRREGGRARRQAVLISLAALAMVIAAASGPAARAAAAPSGPQAGDGGGPSTPPTAPPIATGLGPNPSGATLRLVSQTAWVTPGRAFDLALIAHVPDGTDPVLLSVDVYQRLGSRSEFARSLTTTWSGPKIARPIQGALLSSYPPDASGAIHLHLTSGRLANQLRLPGPGVYPVAVSLHVEGSSTPLARIITHLVSTPASVTRPLNVVWVLPIHVPSPDPKAATAALTPDQQHQITTVVDALATYPKVPVTVQPSPDTVASLTTTDAVTTNRLGQALTGREVLASTWVPTPVPSMLADGLGSEVTLSLTRGGDALSADLGTPVSGRTWVQDGPVNQDSLSFLRFAQFDRVVLPEGDLDANPSPFTITRPFVVAGSDQTVIRAAVADAGLASHFTNQPDPVLAAHQLLADLAQIYADAPSNQRGVVLVTPSSWTADAAFLDTFMGALGSSPLLVGETLDGFFDHVPPMPGRDGAPLNRQLVVDDAAIRAAAAGLSPDGVRAARAQLESLARVLPQSETTVYPPLERLLLEVPSVDLTPAGRQATLAALSRAVQAVIGEVQLPTTRTITLTARRGQLPIAVVSQSDEPLQVLLRVESDKLKFPGAATANTATFPLTLHKGNNPVADLTVETRTSGAFPLRITVLSPDGTMVLAKTTFTVQATALSGVGVFLSVGAALFLVVWWSRHAWKARQVARGVRPPRRHARHRPIPAGAAMVDGGPSAGR